MTVRPALATGPTQTLASLNLIIDTIMIHVATHTLWW